MSGIEIQADTGNTFADNIFVDEHGDRIYPCRCGETHRGPYAAYDYGHHNCLHDDGLIRLMEDAPDYLICPACGKTFCVRDAQSQDSGRS
jgi:predicted RNA-binding Zn-ribbon protein involved in translation (DUF1610 family)